MLSGFLADDEAAGEADEPDPMLFPMGGGGGGSGMAVDEDVVVDVAFSDVDDDVDEL